MATHFDFQASTTASPKHKKKFFVAAALAAVLAFGGLGVAQFAAAEDGGLSAGVIQKVSDLPTDYATHMHEPSDTSMLGRVITDKTVRDVGFDAIDRQTGDTLIKEGNSYVKGSYDIGDNFTVTFSALSSGGDVPGEGAGRPVDVVLILDISSSMINSSNLINGETRAALMVDAANAVIRKLMEENEENRVAVVTYGNAATTIVPLQSINGITGDYLTINSRTATSNVAITPNAAIAGATEIKVAGATNMQAGLFFGMSELLSADAKVTIGGKEYSRVPGVILMSDGIASKINDNEEWWNLTSDDSTKDTGAETDRYWGNGYVAMLEAAYMKNLVQDHYDMDCSIFTVGLGLGDTIINNMGRLDLDPTGVLDNTSWTSSHNAPEEMRKAFASFASGKAYSVPYAKNTSTTNYTYSVKVPTGSAADFKPTSLKYNDAYYAASNVDELVSAFEQSIESLAERAYDPTATDEGDDTGEVSGYVTFTDTLGAFMEVKDFKSILWVDHDPSSQSYGQRIEYTRVEKIPGDTVDTYVFQGTTHSSWRYNYEQVPLSDIKITVDKSGTSDVVTIQVPPALLPMVEYTVKKNGEGEITEAWRNEETAPIKINYEVGPKEGVVSYIAGTSDGAGLGDLKDELDAYLADSNNYVSTDDGRGVAFYANNKSGSGVPAADFQINSGNSYYSFTQKTQLFLDNAGQIPATEFVAGTTYYYKKTVYKVSDRQDVLPEGPIATDSYLTVTSLTPDDVVAENGLLYAKAYTEKDLPKGEDKRDNATKTLPYRYTSRWFDGTNVMQLQGNNGRLVVERPGNLELGKVITLADGLDATGIAIDEEAMNGKKFSFGVELDAPSTDGGTTTYSALEGTYDYVIQNPNKPEAQWATGTITNGRATIQLTQEETLLVKNLPNGTRYTLNETGGQAGYTLVGSTTTYLDENGDAQTADGTSAGGYQLVGYIASSSTSTASFTNEYGFNAEGISISNRPHVKKTLENTTFDGNSYQFFMTIAPYDDNPADVELAATQAEVSLDAVSAGSATQIDANNIDSYFKGITFHAPGTYWFRIAEQNNATAGITYSQSVYAYVVDVHDNGDGTLSINTNVAAQDPDITMQKVIDKDGTSVPEGQGIVEPTHVDGQDVLEATFTNSYNVEEITIGTPGLKAYTDNSGAKALVAEMFDFELRPSFYDENDNPLDPVVVAAVPMPDAVAGTTTGGTRTETIGQNTYTYSYIDTKNSASGDFGYGTITYGLSDAGKTYYYVSQEIIPQDALDNGKATYVNNADASDVLEDQSFHGYVWDKGGTTYDLKTITYKGMVYDCSRHLVKVVVSQQTTDGVTHIVADVQYQTPASVGMHEVVINNVYTPEAVETNDDASTGNHISVTKTLTGRNSKVGESFTFQIAAAGVNSRDGLANDTIVFNGDAGATTMQASTSGALTDGVAQKVFFENITFKRAGTYTFAISEVVPEGSARAAGVAYDQHTANVVVVVALDQEEGKLYIQSATPTAEGADTFTNTYAAEPVEFGNVGALEIGKLVGGRAMVARKYSFTVEAQNENAKAKNAAAGLDETITVLNSSAAADGVEQETAALTGLSFTLADVGKTFTYKVAEVVPAGADTDRKFEGVTYAYDGLLEQYVDYTVADKGDGSLTVTATVTDTNGNTLGTFTSTSGDVSPAVAHFKNKYTVDPVTVDSATVPFSKTIEGREWKEGDAFTFTIEKSPSTAPDPAHSTASIAYADVQGGNNTFDFGSVTFTSAGTYTYTVKEDQSQGAGNGITNDPASRSVRVVVTDNSQGGLAARVEAINSLTFVNTYSATQDYAGVNASKTLTGRSMREREFMVDIRPIDVEGGQDGVTYAPADETADIFGVRETGEIVVINRPESGETQTETIIPGVTLTQANAGMTYAFEVKEFVPSNAEDAKLDGKTYKMRDGVYYNTLGEAFDHWRIEIAVADDGNGTLTTTTTWIAHDKDHKVVDTVAGGSSKDGTTAPVVPFQNTYRATGQAIIKTIKDLRGREWNNNDAFAFAIQPVKVSGSSFVEFTSSEEDQALLATYPEDVTEYPSGTKNTTAVKDADQQVATGQYFAVPSWVFNVTQDNLDPETGIGDFYYKITEIGTDGKAGSGGTKNDIKYSTEVFYAHIHAVDNGKGTVETTLTYEPEPGVVKGATPVFTNTYSVETTSIKVYKVWDDANNQDGIRPDSVTIVLKADGSAASDAAGTAVADLKLNASNNWTGIFENLLVNADGTAIDYTVEEGNIRDYTPKVEYGSASGTWSEAKPNDWNYQVRITNTHVPATHDVPVDPEEPDGEKRGIQTTKVWSDSGASLRSDAVLHLYGRVDGRIVYEGEAKTIAKDAEGAALTVSWNGAPVKLNGKEIAYEVVEDAMPGYTSSVSGDVENGFTVTNTFSEPTTTITASKKWDDANNADGLRGEVQFKLMRSVGGGTPEEVETSAKFIDDGTTITWEGLPAVLPQETSTTTTDPETGDEVTETPAGEVAVLYSVEEVGTPDDYEVVVVATAPGKFEVCNVHVPETIGDVDGPTDPTSPDFKGIKVSKEWADNGDAAGDRPDAVTVQLLQDDEPYGEPKTITPNAQGVWQAGWTGLPKAHDGGIAYVYTVREEDVAAGYSAAVTGSAVDGFTVTNTFNAKQTVVATKTWYEEDGKTVIAESPVAITLHLMKRVGDYGQVEVGSQTIDAGATGNALSVCWPDMPTTENGLPVTYFVTEDKVEGYTTSIGDGTTKDETLTIPVSNTKQGQEPPVPVQTVVLASFVDALNSVGKQVVKLQQTTADAIDSGFDTLKPADPDHTAEGKIFQQWDKNESAITLEDGTDTTLVTFVARYQDTSGAKKTVSYVNGQAASGSQLVKSEATDDPSSVLEPDDKPTAENMVFVGWEGPVTDAAGNLVYMAKFSSDCSNSSDPDSDPTPAPNSDPAPTPGSTPTPKSAATPVAGSAAPTATPKTADSTPFAAVALLVVVSGAVLVVSRRQQEQRAAHAEHKTKAGM